MDNLTHTFIGLAAAKAGLEKLSPGATALCVLAANSPDADILALLGGRWTYLEHHRGITHSIVGALVLALALPLLLYLGDRLIAQLRKRPSTVKLKGLVIASLIVTATHPLMDWTNNYGMRFLLPWNPTWSYGDFVFIIDPFIWVVLGGAAFLLTSKTKLQIAGWIVILLLSSYIVLVGPSGPMRLENPTLIRSLWIAALLVLVVLFVTRFGQGFGAKLAVAALATVMIYLAGLAVAHSFALRQAQTVAGAIAGKNNEQILKLAAMPTVANPTAWVCAMETDRASYRFTVSLLRSAADPSKVSRFEKPTGIAAMILEQAKSDYRAEAFLRFARFPATKVEGGCETQTLVQFADIRYTDPGRGFGTFSLEVPVKCLIQTDKGR